jgi:hypothetical protein
MQSNARRVTRDELYALVWGKPMSRLAEEFGITGNGLAKVCDRLDVPYPPRGYWAKKEAGKPTVTFKLPPRKPGGPDATDIYPTPSKPPPLPEAAQSASAAAEKVEGITVPETMYDLHPRVKAWLAEHKKEQREREIEGRRRGRDSWWARSPIPGLTERDLYRFRVSSAIFRGVETAGGKFESTPISGRVCFLIDGHKVECNIVEKLVKSLKPREQTETWTAYPGHHQSGLASSGFLRVSFTTFVMGKPQWVETDKKKISDMLPNIIGTIMAAGPTLEKQRVEREEAHRRYEEEQARRYEAQRLKEIDDKRWKLFQDFASNWEQRSKLLPFITELESRLEAEGDVLLGDRPLSAWIAWAKCRAEALDPFRRGAVGLFESISKVTQWS